jgi:hypothetical protein
MTTPRTMAEQAVDIAADLVGSCRDLNTVTTEFQRNSAEFCAVLDENAGQCDGCGWWFETEELNEAWQCEDCSELP